MVRACGSRVGVVELGDCWAWTAIPESRRPKANSGPSRLIRIGHLDCSDGQHFYSFGQHLSIKYLISTEVPSGESGLENKPDFIGIAEPSGRVSVLGNFPS